MSTPDSEPTLRGFALGQHVFDRYTLARRLGAGGMGEVWLARDESLAVDVCLKFLPPHVRWSPSALAAHKAEALRARTLAHPHIVRVHDFAEDAAHAAIVMEFVDGRTLAAERAAQRGGTLAPAEIAAWLPQLATALDYLHREARVAHGDLKPANILLRRDGVLKLADFGVARDLAQRADAEAGGTLAYLSPQRVLGTASAPADDIYALGAMLYEMLTGRPPFFEGDIAAQIELLAPEPVAARRHRLGVPAAGSIPAAWESAIQCCLAKRAADRPASAGAAVAQLGRHVSAPASKRRAALVACGFGVVALAAAWWWRARHASPPLVPAVPRAVAEFAETFDSGLAGWMRWGEPPPRILSDYHGRTWVFDNNGDGIHPSGVTSIAVIAAPRGFELRSDVRLDVTNPAGCHLAANISLTLEPAHWMNALGSEGDCGDGLWLGIEYAGDTCWGTDPAHWRHAYFSAFFTAEDGTRVLIGQDLPREQWVADTFLNRWTTLRVAVDAERRVRFYADDTLLWAPPQKLHPRVLAGQRVLVHGRSAGNAGKAYHDNLILRAPPGATLAVTAAPAAAAPPDAPLPWGEAAWAQRTLGGAAPAAWPARGEELLLAAPTGGVLALRTRTALREFAAAEFEVRPFLNSGGAQPDALVVFVERRAAGGGWQRWAAELRGTELHLVERAPDGRDSAVSRAGTYATGAWATLAFTREADGAVALTGSRLQPTRFATLAAHGDGEWAVGFELSNSADGAAVRPPRVIVRP